MTRPTARSARAAVAVLVIVTGALAAGCGSTPAASGAASPTDAPPTAIVTPVPTAAGPEGDVLLTAENIAFVETEVTAPAGASFTLVLVNKDAGVPHGIEILDDAGRSIYRSDIVTGPATPVFDVPALAAGKYRFQCPVHPNMTGVLQVGG